MKNKSHLKNRGHIKFRMEEVYSHLHNNTNGNKEQSLCCLVLMPCARASTRYVRAHQCQCRKFLQQFYWRAKHQTTDQTWKFEQIWVKYLAFSEPKVEVVNQCKCLFMFLVYFLCMKIWCCIVSRICYIKSAFYGKTFISIIFFFSLIKEACRGRSPRPLTEAARRGLT